MVPFLDKNINVIFCEKPFFVYVALQPRSGLDRFVEVPRSHTHTHTSVGLLGTSDELSQRPAHTQHTTNKRLTTTPSAGFVPAIPAFERPLPNCHRERHDPFCVARVKFRVFKYNKAGYRLLHRPYVVDGVICNKRMQ